MRILVVGAGSIGGYFGGRLLQAGRDVTFLVRPGRAAQLAKTGLCLRSPAGDFDLPNPPLVTAGAITQPFDLILLSCKAYDLDGAIDSFAAAVGPDTAILPMLNGMAHLDALEKRFGAKAVLGGLCLISTMLDADGHIVHLAPAHAMTFGERDGTRTPRVDAILAQLDVGRFDIRASETILQEMWEKWVFIATAAGTTCLMRSAIGDIVAGGGADIAVALLNECAAIAAGQGFTPRPATLDRARTMFTAAGSLLTASMARDIERRGPVESEQIMGDLLRRAGDKAHLSPVLRIVYVHLKAYEARLAREAA